MSDIEFNYGSIGEGLLAGGRLECLEAMAVSVSREVERRAVSSARCALQVHRINKPMEAKYDRKGETTISWGLHRQPEVIADTEQVLVPIFPVNPVTPTRLRRLHLRHRGQEPVEQAVLKTAEGIIQAEDGIIFDLLAMAALWSGNNINVLAEKKVEEAVDNGFSRLEGEGLIGTNIFVTPKTLTKLAEHPEFEEGTQREIQDIGVYGHLYTANVRCSEYANESQIILTAQPDEVGRMPKIGRVQDLPPVYRGNDIELLFVEEAGFVVLNGKAVVVLNRVVRRSGLPGESNGS